MNARTEPDNLFAPEEPSIAMLRIPPHSIEAETSVLGGLLLDNSAWDRVGDILTENDFYRYEHRLIYAAMAGMINACKPADAVTVYAQLQAIGKASEAGGLKYLGELAQYVPSATNIRRYSEIVREKSVLRGLVVVGDQIATMGFNPGGKSVEAVLNDAEGLVFGIGQSVDKAADDWEDIERGMVRELDRIQMAQDGNAPQDFIPTHFTELDERLDGGLRGGELYVIGARPSMGKTALGLNIVENIAMRERLPVAIFSMEMPRSQLHRRMMATMSRIHLSRIKRPERLRDSDWGGVTEAVELLRHAPIHINDKSGLNIHQIRSKARALKRRTGKLGAILVDYFSLMSGTDPKVPRVYQLQEASTGLKSLAKELDCPVILLQQVKREVEGRADPVPIMSDLKDSGSLEQDADVIIFVHRPFKADPKLSEDWRPVAEVSVPKLRDGETGSFFLHFTGEHQLFEDWPTSLDVPTLKTRNATAAPRKAL